MSANPTIRLAREEDIASVQRLLRESGTTFDGATWQTIPGHRYLLVLDAPDGGLAAVAQVTLAAERGHLVLLAVAKAFEGTGLEDRFIAVVEAMCEAFGVVTLDVLPRRAA